MRNFSMPRANICNGILSKSWGRRYNTRLSRDSRKSDVQCSRGLLKYPSIMALTKIFRKTNLFTQTIFPNPIMEAVHGCNRPELVQPGCRALTNLEPFVIWTVQSGILSAKRVLRWQPKGYHFFQIPGFLVKCILLESLRDTWIARWIPR